MVLYEVYSIFCISDIACPLAMSHCAMRIPHFMCIRYASTLNVLLLTLKFKLMRFLTFDNNFSFVFCFRYTRLWTDCRFNQFQESSSKNQPKNLLMPFSVSLVAFCLSSLVSTLFVIGMVVLTSNSKLKHISKPLLKVHWPS